MLINVRGVIYQSVRHAAESLGVSKDAVYSALARGSTDKLGLGNTQRKPTELFGSKFRSLGDAGRALGLRRSFSLLQLSYGRTPLEQVCTTR